MTDITMDVDTKALRQRILTLAIQGKLTDQRKEDGTAQDLYNQIQEEKKRLIKEKKIKKTKKLPVITEDEIPFKIPGNWIWVKLGNVSDYGGTKLKVSPGDIDSSTWVLDMEDIEKESGKILLYKTGIHKSIKGDRAVFSKGDILYSKLRPYLKKILIAPKDGVCTTELVPFSCYGGINHRYLVSVLKSSYVTNVVNAVSYGVKMPRVGKDIMENLIIPLPPLAEQKRIADKVSSLFVQLDAIDKAYEEYRELQQTMKSRLLEQAIQGKLTDQRKEDGNAQDLYNQIQEEKQRLIKEKKIKKAKPLPAITEEEKRFELPQSWKWCKIDDLAFVTKLAGFEYTEYIQPNLQQNGVPLIKGKNVQNGEIVWSFESYIPEKISDELFRSQLSKKCLLTPYVGTIGNIAIFDAHIKAHLGSNVGKIELFNNTEQHVLEEYVFYYLKSPIGLSELQKHKKSTAQASISIQAIRDVNIPLPPLAEQKRIVEKLDKLLPLCEA